MKKAHLLIAVALLVHAVAWLLPVVKDGVTLPDGLPGWQAFTVAALAINNWTTDPKYFVVLSELSALTTILFVLGAGWVVAIRSRRLRRVSAWIAACSFLIDAHWFLWFGSDRFNLRVGYFLWWASFLLLAIGLFLLSNAFNQTPIPNGQEGLDSASSGPIVR
jgi:hypothetical protein